MGVLNIPNVFSAGQDVRPTGMNDNFAAVSTVVNGGINKDNLANGAVTYSRLGTDARKAAGYTVGNNGGDVTVTTNVLYTTFVTLTNTGLKRSMMLLDVSLSNTFGFASLASVELSIDGLSPISSRVYVPSSGTVPMALRFMSPVQTAGSHTYGFKIYYLGSGANIKMTNSSGVVPRMTVYEA